MKRIEYFFGQVVSAGMNNHNILPYQAFWNGGRDLERFLDRAWEFAGIMEMIASEHPEPEPPNLTTEELLNEVGRRFRNDALLSETLKQLLLLLREKKIS